MKTAKEARKMTEQNLESVKSNYLDTIYDDPELLEQYKYIQSMMTSAIYEGKFKADLDLMKNRNFWIKTLEHLGYDARPVNKSKMYVSWSMDNGS